MRRRNMPFLLGVIGEPSKSIVPDSGATSLLRSRSSVDLAQPIGPIDAVQRIFIREFRDDFFARAKAEFVIGDVNSLIDLTDEMHFNSACAGIVDRTVPPVAQIKVRSEFAVGVRQ